MANNRVTWALNEDTTSIAIATSKSGYIIKPLGDTLEITQGDTTKIYKGQKCNIVGDVILLDGRPITPDDDRLINIVKQDSTTRSKNTAAIFDHLACSGTHKSVIDLLKHAIGSSGSVSISMPISEEKKSTPMSIVSNPKLASSVPATDSSASSSSSSSPAMK